MYQTVTGSKNLKKAAAIFMLFAFLCQPAAAFAGGLTNATDIKGNQQSNIYYGSYWQNGSGTDLSGYTKTAVKYRVLAASGTSSSSTGTGQILLLSDQGLYTDQFNAEESMGNTWNSSQVRQTLGAMTTKGATAAPTSYNDLGTGFARDAFSAAEYNAISNTTHIAGGGFSGNTTSSTDKLFLLSAEEVDGMYGFGSGKDSKAAKNSRKMTATTMAKNVKIYGNTKTAVDIDGHSNWWLRSPGSNDSYIAYIVDYYGTPSGCNVSFDGQTVRAAFNLNSDSILFASAATGGKSEVKSGDGFALADYKGADYKLTIKDSSIATPGNISVTQEHTDVGVKNLAETIAVGGTLDLTSGVTETYGGVKVSYEDATTGTNMYVSAIVSNSSGLVNYAKIKAADTAANASGTNVAVGITNLADGEYTMQLFGEQANGDYATDYASNLSSSYTIHKGTGTFNEGTLSTDYKAKGLTAALGNGFNLSFGGAGYSTNVSVAATGASLFGAGSTIKSLAVGGNTKVSGSMNVATLTRTDGTVTVNGMLTSDKMNSTGSNNKLSATGTTVYGANNTVLGDNSAAFGNNNTISGANTFALGNNIAAGTYTNSVVLGNGSAVNQSGVVSVGSETAKRKIINVAAGTADTDAATVKQSSVYVGGTKVNNANGVKFTSSDGSVTFDTSTAGTLDIKATSGGSGGTDTNAVHYDNATTKNSVTFGTAGTEVALKNVKAGDITVSTSTDAVNGGQLYTTNQNVAALQGNFESDGTTAKAATKATKDGAGNTITATYATKTETGAATSVKINSGSNINTGSGVNLISSDSSVTFDTSTAGTIDIKAVGGGSSGSDAKAVHYEYNSGQKTNNIVLEGQNADDKVTIKNVAAGDITSASSTDAVNGGQLYETNEQLKTTNEQLKGTYTDATYANSKLTLTKVDGSKTELKIESGGGTTSGGDKPEGAKEAEAKGEGAVAIGYDSQAKADGATALGYGNRATGEMSTAVGYKNVVTGSKSGAFGDPNTVSGTGSYAIGNDNTITGDNTFVLGNNVKTSAKNAVVLGNNSTATRDNTVSVGAPGAERQITNVAAGTMGTDAANMNQLWGVEKESREIAAMSGALAGLHYLEPSGEGDDRVTGAVAYGGYRGENAAAVGLAYKPSPNVMLSASTSVGNSQNIYNAGVSVKFGKGKTVNRAEMAKQIKYLGEENDKLKSTVEAQGKENAELKNTVAQQGEQLQQQGVQIQELLKAVKNMQKKPAAAKDGSKKARGKRY